MGVGPPSIRAEYGRPFPARILVLEVRDRRKPESEPLGWLLIEREATYERDSADGSIERASISLYYERIMPKHEWRDHGQSGDFAGSFSRARNSVSLSSAHNGRGAIFLDTLRGHRVGTYLLNQIVIWVQQWPEASVQSIELLGNQAEKENKTRRNRFYERFGLEFDYTDPEQREGRSRPMLVKDLKQVLTWKENIREHELLSYLGEQVTMLDDTRGLLRLRDREVESLWRERDEMRAKPLGWALRTLWQKHAHVLGAVVGIALLAALIWRRLSGG